MTSRNLAVGKSVSQNHGAVMYKTQKIISVVFRAVKTSNPTYNQIGLAKLSYIYHTQLDRDFPGL